jgi:hypothetical protein
MKLHSGPHSIHRPAHGRQGERLSPQFSQLQVAFSSRRVELQQTITGIDPERVLVIETIGDIENFANAVKRIPGLEWMGELDVDEITPDQDFYDTKKPTKKMSGRLYLVMTNQQALTQMLSLWNHYKANPAMVFDRGLTKFRYLFECLKDIRFWDVEDRFRDTGVLEAWKKDIESDGDRIIRFETELWYRDTEEKRNVNQRAVSDLIQNFNGNILKTCIIPEIGYHSLLAELPANAIQEIIAHPNTKLTECDGIMFFRPIGQMSVGKGSIHGEKSEISSEEIERLPIPSGEPLIAIFDGLPLAQHQLLLNRLIIDDPDDWSSAYLASDCEHGTGMASLIIHGDLNNGINPLSRRLYVRPIFKPDPSHPVREEYIPEEEELAIDLIHRAVRRVVEGDGGGPAVAPTVKIINLSIGDPNRQFYQIMSPLARLLDWLSIRYNVLFVVSAGNQMESIDTGLARDEFNRLSPVERENVVVQALFNDSHKRKILSPAESINALTVGSAHHDTAPLIPQNHRINPYEVGIPSPYSSFGSGYRRSVKPDLLYPGGRQFYEASRGNQDTIILEGSISIEPPGIKVAAPGRLAGDLNKTIFCCGTSNSAALISRSASICYDNLNEIFESQAPGIDHQSYIVPLLKAMVVHGCSWGETEYRIESILDLHDKKQLKNKIVRWCGYGISEIDKVLNCTENRATLLGHGQLNDDEAHIFSLPFPPSLSGRREWRKLTITLAWISPISAGTQKYRRASLWFDVGSEPFGSSRADVELNTARRGTIQHEVFEGDQIMPFSDGEALEIKVNCRKDAGNFNSPIKYGLVVSLEVAEGVDIPVYNEIRTRIAPPIQIRPGAPDTARGAGRA